MFSSLDRQQVWRWSQHSAETLVLVLVLCLLSVMLRSWSKVQFPSSSSQQDRTEPGGRLRISAAVRLISLSSPPVCKRPRIRTESEETPGPVLQNKAETHRWHHDVMTMMMWCHWSVFLVSVPSCYSAKKWSYDPHVLVLTSSFSCFRFAWSMAFSTTIPMSLSDSTVGMATRQPHDTRKEAASTHGLEANWKLTGS